MDKKKLFIIFLTLAGLVVLLYAFNPGYHYRSCSCSYHLYLKSPQVDCARFCQDNERNTTKTEKMKVINTLLFTDLIRNLKKPGN